MDVLFNEDDTGLSCKAVLRLPVQYLAERAASLPGDLLITGREMGGGAAWSLCDICKKNIKKISTVT